MMLTWYEEIVIPVNIELVWKLFSLENMQRIMPQVVEMKILEAKDGVVGSTYEQTYSEGKRTQTYIVTDLEHEDTSLKKHNTSAFTLAKLFDIKVSYTLIKLSEEETRLIYQGQNKGRGLLGKLLVQMSKLGNSDKEADAFIMRVSEESLKEKRKR